jgi:tRNA(fMet)-specific endonuclease VapC
VKFLLDTNTCIYVINRRPPEVFEQLAAHGIGDVGVSSITAGELAFGTAKSRSPKNRAALEKFLAPLEVMPFDEAASWAYGDLRSALEQSGTPIGSLDTLIAAHALSLDCCLITNNLREFRRVPGLRLENWVGRVSSS